MNVINRQSLPSARNTSPSPRDPPVSGANDLDTHRPLSGLSVSSTERIRRPSLRRPNPTPGQISIQPAPDSARRAVIRNQLGGRQSPEELPRERVLAAPCDGAMGLDTLEGPDQKHPEVRLRSDRRASVTVGVERTTEFLHRGVEPCSCEHLVPVLVEGAAGTLEIFRGHPWGALLLPASPAHRQVNLQTAGTGAASDGRSTCSTACRFCSRQGSSSLCTRAP